MERWYYGHHFGMPVFWLIVFIIIVALVFARSYRIPGERTTKDTPLDLLKRRFANGDIDKEEFEERKKSLQQN